MLTENRASLSSPTPLLLLLPFLLFHYLTTMRRRRRRTEVGGHERKPQASQSVSLIRMRSAVFASRPPPLLYAHAVLTLAHVHYRMHNARSSTPLAGAEITCAYSEDMVRKEELMEPAITASEWSAPWNTASECSPRRSEISFKTQYHALIWSVQ